MEKIKKIQSLKWRFLLYLPIPFLLAVIGTYVIGYGSNKLQSVYRDHFFTSNAEYISEIKDKYQYEIVYVGDVIGGIQYVDEDSVLRILPVEESYYTQSIVIKLGYLFISNAQIVLIPVWIILCMAVASVFFYKKEIEEGLTVLIRSSERIADNELDFEVPKTKKNEIGLVCESFDLMRKSLLQISTEHIRMTEEARRLNAAFSHDIRTPITVMKGYVDLLEKYVPEERISKKKELEILEMLQHQVKRLENYALSMSSVQKLEDRVPNRCAVNYKQMEEEIKNICRLIDERVVFTVRDNPDQVIDIDKELVFEVVENIVSNAARYAKEKIMVAMSCNQGFLEIEVSDDGAGFSQKILKMAGDPFLREDKEEDKQHLGLGIYISKLLCEKCGGKLILENQNGACVKALFKIKEE